MPVGFIVKFLAFAKKRWRALLGLSVAIAIGALLLRRDRGWTDKYRELERSHGIELKEIDAARMSERAELEAIVEKLKVELNESRLLYEKQKSALDHQRRERIDRIVRESGDDPNELAQQLSRTMGLRVKVP